MKTMLMQIFGVTTKEHYGMLWYFLEWSINISAWSAGTALTMNCSANDLDVELIESWDESKKILPLLPQFPIALVMAAAISVPLGRAFVKRKNACSAG